MMPMLSKTQNWTHAQELVTLRTGRPVDELLRERYVDERKPLVEIAQELGVSRNTISMWLREFGIERPPLI
jgi:hypothetical protein